MNYSPKNTKTNPGSKRLVRHKADMKNVPVKTQVHKTHTPKKSSGNGCVHAAKCGACSMIGLPYAEQLKTKQKRCEELVGSFGKVEQIIGMKEPAYYRHKVHRVFGYSRKNGLRIGTYEEHTHRIVSIDECLIEDETCQAVLNTVAELVKSFKYKIYDEDTGYGLFRHALVRRGMSTGEILVVLVMTSPVMPGKNNFIKALIQKHPEIKSVVLNINDRDTTMVLGKQEKVLYGPGYISDFLCGLMFRISASSFYQVNPAQAERVYETAIKYADVKDKDIVVDAYCGTGTIGLTAIKDTQAQLVGIELAAEAVRDARQNAKVNGIKNAAFYVGDAGEILTKMAEGGERADVIFMDPPRSGSNETFMRAAISVKPSRIVYVSCGPDTLARDLRFLTSNGYKVKKIQPIDLFPMTQHVEVVTKLERI